MASTILICLLVVGISLYLYKTGMSESNKNDCEEIAEERNKKIEEKREYFEKMKENEKIAIAEEEKKAADRKAHMKEIISEGCKICGGYHIPMKQGYGVKKGIVGLALLGPVGLIAGGINKNKIELVCTRCGNKTRRITCQ